MPSNTILCIGSALIDVFITSDAFELDSNTGVLKCGSKAGKLEVESFDIRTGGGASNTAVGFARMGFKASCLAEMGRDEQAQLLVDTLKEEGVDTSLLIKEKKEQTGGSVVMVTNSGERMVLVHRGAASMLDPQDIPSAAFEGLDWLHLSSIGSQHATLEHIFAMVRQLPERQRPRVSWNPGTAILSSLVEQTWQIETFPVEVMMVNKEEWEIVVSVQDRLLASIPQIIITDGSRGGQIFVDGRLTHQYQGKQVAAIDNTGAGDAFAVGYVSALLKDKEITTAADWGARNAASVVQQLGAKPGLLYLSSIEV